MPVLIARYRSSFIRPSPVIPIHDIKVRLRISRRHLNKYVIHAERIVTLKVFTHGFS